MGERDWQEVWTTVQLDEADKGRKDRPRGYSVIGRLKDGVTIAAAEADLKTLQAQIAKTYEDPDVRENRASVIVRRYADSIVEADLKRALIALLAAAGVLWLIACVNVTNLLLVRATARQREIAVRGALGASRGRIMQQLVTEGLFLSGAASFLGSLLALGAIKVFEKQIPSHLPLQITTSANSTILLALVGLTLLSTVFSSAMALISRRAHAYRTRAQAGWAAEWHEPPPASHSQLLVIAEIAMSLTLLAACGLLLRTIYAESGTALKFLGMEKKSTALTTLGSTSSDARLATQFAAAPRLRLFLLNLVVSEMPKIPPSSSGRQPLRT